MSEFAGSTVFCRNDINGNQVGDEIVLFDDRAGKYFALTPVAAEIWRLLETPQSLDAILKALLSHYEVDERKCNEQVQSFLGAMVQNQLIVVSGGST